jgi:hypothetical protein
VEHAGERHLGRFRAVRYPEKDHAPEAALLEKIRTALRAAPSGLQPPETGAAEAGAAEAGAATEPGAATPEATQGAAKPATTAPEPRTIALIALMQAAGLLGKLFPEADRIRASELAKDYWPSRAVEDELRMIRLAEEEAANL